VLSLESLPTSPDPILEGLTAEQHAAVTHGEGPLLIVAGAGTGKTSVLTRRLAWLVASRRARPEEILALTFTDKAAREMEERVDQLVPYGYVDLQIGTFHSFGYRLLREHALEIGLDPNLVVLSRPQQVLLLRERLFDLPLERYRPLGDPTAWLDALAAFVGRAKDEDISPERYLAWAENLKTGACGDDELDFAAQQLELARAYEACQRLMAERGYVDFGDQVYRVLQMLRARPSILKTYQRRFRFVLVDEFQDTNHAQFELIRLLAGGHGNVTVVGDDDQAIYRFRGAAISNILNFTETYPAAQQVVLTRNFRSTQRILDASYRLIVHNNPDRLEVRNRIDKRLVSNRGEGVAPTHQVFDTTSSEADEVARIIADNVAAGRHGFGAHAILVRSNRDADPYLRSLNMRGIPFRFAGSRGLYSRPEVRLLLSFMRVVADYADNVSLYELAVSDVYQMDPMALAILNGVVSRRHVELFDVMRAVLAPDPERVAAAAQDAPADERRPPLEKLIDRDWSALAALDETARAVIGRIVEDVREHVALAATLGPGQVLYHFLRGSGLLERLARMESVGDDVALQNIARFFDIVKTYEVLDARARLPQFVRHLDLLMEAGDNPAMVEADPDESAVAVLTVHKSKGLEFPVVFVVGATDGKFPTRPRAEAMPLAAELVPLVETGTEQHVQEERRLFYVAMTRAKDALHLFSARDAGARRARKVSPFVGEALDSEKEAAAPARTSPGEMLLRYSEPAVAPQTVPGPLAPDDLLVLSHKQLDDYLTCPLKYKFVHVLRVPLLSHHSVIYGRALHEAISWCNKSRQLHAEGKAEAPTVEGALEVFARSWVNEGFLSRAHEEQRFANGERVLREWVARESAEPRVPTLVEQEFSFQWGRDRFVGRFDRVDRWDGGSAIVDYKSTDVRTQEDADKRARDNLQLNVYALAYAERFGELPGYVELQFLESGTAGRARKSRRDLEETKRQMVCAARGVRARVYAAKPDYKACQACAFSEFCPSSAATVRA